MLHFAFVTITFSKKPCCGYFYYKTFGHNQVKMSGNSAL